MDNVPDEIGLALAATAAVVGGVPEARWASPTPCEGWDARALTNHLVGGLRLFAAEIDGVPAPGDFATDWLGDDPAGAYRTAARHAAAAWHREGVLDRTLRISLGPVPGRMAALIQLTEIVVHGADLAVATGQTDRIDESLCERLLATMLALGTMDSFRMPEVFGPEVSVVADGPAHRRLLAFLGRTLPSYPNEPHLTPSRQG